MAKKSSREKYKVAEIVAILEAVAGNKSLAAVRLGCSRNTIDAYIARYPEIAAALVEIRETFKDYTESQLKILVKEKNPQAVFFALRTLARDRGYSERTEITGPGGQPIETKTVPAIDPNNLTQDERRLLLALMSRAKGRPGIHDDVFVAKGILEPWDSTRANPSPN